MPRNLAGLRRARKILARAAEELESAPYGPPGDDPRRERDWPRDDYRGRDYERPHDSYDREPPSSRPKHQRPYKHKSFWHELFD